MSGKGTSAGGKTSLGGKYISLGGKWTSLGRKWTSWAENGPVWVEIGLAQQLLCIGDFYATALHMILKYHGMTSSLHFTNERVKLD